MLLEGIGSGEKSVRRIIKLDSNLIILVKHLAEIGYDSNSLFMAAYDWRMSPALMQTRDAYFTKLLSMIQVARSTNQNRRVVLIAHSYATQVVLYFLKWVESPLGGRMKSGWIDDNIVTFSTIYKKNWNIADEFTINT